jgi:hypothetical protein
MNDWIYMLALGFAAYAISSTFYHCAIRPMLCDRGRFRLFSLRDDLRQLAIEGKVSASSFEYQYLEALLCRLIEKCSWLSVSSLVEFVQRNKKAELSPEAVRFEAEASDDLKGIYYGAILEMMKVMFNNSPIWTLVLTIIFGISSFFGWATKQWLDIKAKIFLEEQVTDTGLLAT